MKLNHDIGTMTVYDFADNSHLRKKTAILVNKGLSRTIWPSNWPSI